jgi:O-acetyl-ADP-ribose deacetylase (regulator of RNase III)
MIELIRGDITTLKVDAIVNAANSSLLGGGGVDGAIHRRGGSAILEECKMWKMTNGNLKTGQAMITSGGQLPARYVIHTVGPVWQQGLKNEDVLLADCYINALHIAHEKKLTSIAFPNISTGVYRFPKHDAAEVAVATVQNFLGSYPDPLQVTFVCFDEENFEIYKHLL